MRGGLRDELKAKNTHLSYMAYRRRTRASAVILRNHERSFNIRVGFIGVSAMLRVPWNFVSCDSLYPVQRSLATSDSLKCKTHLTLPGRISLARS